MNIKISDIRKLAKSAWGTKNREDSIDLLIEKLEEFEERLSKIESKNPNFTRYSDDIPDSKDQWKDGGWQ